MRTKLLLLAAAIVVLSGAATPPAAAAPYVCVWVFVINPNTSPIVVPVGNCDKPPPPGYNRQGGAYINGTVGAGGGVFVYYVIPRILP